MYQHVYTIAEHVNATHLQPLCLLQPAIKDTISLNKGHYIFLPLKRSGQSLGSIPMCPLIKGSTVFTSIAPYLHVHVYITHRLCACIVHVLHVCIHVHIYTFFSLHVFQVLLEKSSHKTSAVSMRDVMSVSHLIQTVSGVRINLYVQLNVQYTYTYMCT